MIQFYADLVWWMLAGTGLLLLFRWLRLGPPVRLTLWIATFAVLTVCTFGWEAVPFRWRDLLRVGIGIAGGLWLAVQAGTARRQTRRDDLADGRAPSLGLRLATILVPVLVLAVVGVVGLWRDRAAVEAEARVRSREVAEDLVSRMSNDWPWLLSTLEAESRFLGDDWGYGSHPAPTPFMPSGGVLTRMQGGAPPLPRVFSVGLDGEPRHPGGLPEKPTASPSNAPALVALARQRRQMEADIRAMAPALREFGVGSHAAPRAAWFDLGDGSWFVDAWPNDETPAHFDGAVMRMTTNPLVTVRAFPSKAVEWAGGRVLEKELERLADRQPAGMRIQLELAGRPIGSDAKVPAIPMARAEGVFGLVGFAGDPSKAGGWWNAECWPSHPAFAISVILEDPAALHAAHRGRVWNLGAIILLTACVAGVGAWETRRAFRRQVALNEEQANFVSSVSHELRAPLASVRLLAEGLAGGRVGDEAKRREYAGLILQETRRLGVLVENVLDLSRIGQGRRTYERVPTDLARLVTVTARIPAPLADQRGIAIECRVPGDGDIEIRADATALQQALLNLLDNALKHAPRGTSVRVALERVPGNDRRVRIAVSDSGPGIPAEDRERVFERFYRRGSELRRETQGVGLGLAIVRHVVEGHGGRVWVEDGLEGGARVVMELVIDDAGNGPVPAEDRKPPAAPPEADCASFRQRFAARLIDAVVLMPLAVVGVALVWLPKGVAMVLVVAMGIAGAAYFVVGHARFGQTLGKRAMRIRVVRATGGPIGWREAWSRSSVDLGLSLAGIVGCLAAMAAVPAGADLGVGWPQRLAHLASRVPAWIAWIGPASAAWPWIQVAVMLSNRRRRAPQDFIAGTVVTAYPRNTNEPSGDA